MSDKQRANRMSVLQLNGAVSGERPLNECHVLRSSNPEHPSIGKTRHLVYLVKSQPIIRLALLLLLITASEISLAEQNNCFVVGTSYPLVDAVITRSLRAAFSAKGECIRVVNIPPKRSAVMLKTGKIDGELLRSKAYVQHIKAYGFALDVPIVHGHALLVGSFHKTACSRCQTEATTIGVREGLVWPLNYVSDGLTIVEFPTYLAGLEMLDRGRVSAILIDSITFQAIAPSDKYETKKLSPERPAFFVLSNKHKDKKTKLNSVIQTMQYLN